MSSFLPADLSSSVSAAASRFISSLQLLPGAAQGLWHSVPALPLSALRALPGLAGLPRVLPPAAVGVLLLLGALTVLGWVLPASLRVLRALAATLLPFLFGAPPLRRRGRWAVVTGANGALGAAYARAAGRAGLDVVLIARSADKVEPVAAALRSAGRTAVVLLADLAAPGALDDAFAARLAAATAEGGVALLVNNAGVSYPAPLHFHELDERAPGASPCIVAVNCAALARMAEIVLPGMVSRRRGAILNIGSAVSRSPIGSPMLATCASRARGRAGGVCESGASALPPLTPPTLPPTPTRRLGQQGIRRLPHALARHRVRPQGRPRAVPRALLCRLGHVQDPQGLALDALGGHVRARLARRTRHRRPLHRALLAARAAGRRAARAARVGAGEHRRRHARRPAQALPQEARRRRGDDGGQDVAGRAPLRSGGGATREGAASEISPSNDSRYCCVHWEVDSR